MLRKLVCSFKRIYYWLIYTFTISLYSKANANWFAISRERERDREGASRLTEFQTWPSAQYWLEQIKSLWKSPKISNFPIRLSKCVQQFNIVDQYTYKYIHIHIHIHTYSVHVCACLCMHIYWLGINIDEINKYEIFIFTIKSSSAKTWNTHTYTHIENTHTATLHIHTSIFQFTFLSV